MHSFLLLLLNIPVNAFDFQLVRFSTNDHSIVAHELISHQSLHLVSITLVCGYILIPMDLGKQGG